MTLIYINPVSRTHHILTHFTSVLLVSLLHSHFQLH